MKLPNMKYRESATARELVSFGGINYTDNFARGELAECKNLTLDRAPYLSVREKRAAMADYSNAESIYEWDGHMVVADDGVLYYDGEALCNVMHGVKQFAVVNSKIIIYPDKRYIDVTTGEHGKLDAETTALSPVINEQNRTLSASVKPLVESGLETIGFGYLPIPAPIKINFGTYVYGTDSGGISWSASTGWSLPAPQKAIFFTDIADPKSVNCDKHIEVGDIFIPEKSGNSYSILYDGDGGGASWQIDTSRYNNEGYYAVVTGTKCDDSGGYNENGIVYSYRTNFRIIFDVYKVGYNSALFSSSFRVGDTVSLSFSKIDEKIENLEIIEINNFKNELTFAEGQSVKPCSLFGILDRDIDTSCDFVNFDQEYTTKDGSGRYIGFKPDRLIRQNCRVLFFEEKMHIKVYDQNFEFVAEYTADYYQKLDAIKIADITSYLTTDITIKREIPELDFICESNNRLWGVSNKDNSIYVSALGEPARFYEYRGVDTDSYASVVGTDGDFTGICALGDSVLFFKENVLHKMVGSYPSEYQSAVYHVPGVQKGSHNAMVVYGEVLYYKGIDGIYSYSGSMPRLLSNALGKRKYFDAAAGAARGKYYISMRDSEEKWNLFVYDMTKGAWIREDDLRATSFCVLDGELYMLSGDSVYALSAGDADIDESIEWEAVFTPFYESIEAEGRCSMLYLRCQMSKGTLLEALWRTDDGKWVSAGKLKGEREGVYTFPIVPLKCDKFELKLKGEGNFALLEMAHELRMSKRI